MTATAKAGGGKTIRDLPDEREGALTKQAYDRLPRNASHVAAATPEAPAKRRLPGDVELVLNDLLDGAELTVEWWHSGAGVALTTPDGRTVLSYVAADRLAAALHDCTARARAAIRGTSEGREREDQP